MRMRRLLAVLLLLSMLVSVVPTSVFAVETENGSDGETAATAVDPSAAPSDNLFVDKTVTLTEDGTYSINMEAYATGTPITKTVELGVPLDVVLVVDQSGSLKDSGSVDTMKNSIRDFVNALKENGEAVNVKHRVSICGFASGKFTGWTGLQDKYGYSYAGDVKDMFFTNTGLFVNGEFKKYGGVKNYTPHDDKSADSFKDNTWYMAKPREGDQEYKPVLYYPKYSAWYHWDGQGRNGIEIFLDMETKQECVDALFEEYYVYEFNDEVVNQLTKDDYINSWEDISDGQGNLNPDVEKAINSLAANGSTQTSYGLKMARQMLENAPKLEDDSERKKVVIVFTDGKAGGSKNSTGEMPATLAEANKIKDINAKIYTIGIYKTTTANQAEQFMNQLSSNGGSYGFSVESTTGMLDTKNAYYAPNELHTRSTPYFYQVKNSDGTVDYYPIGVNWEADTIVYNWYYITDNGFEPIPDDMLNKEKTQITGVYTLESGEYNPDLGYYYTSTSFNDLSGFFQTVLDKETIFYSEVELGTTAILKDVLADGFTLTDNTQITVSVVPGSVSEENSNLSPNELTRDKITWDEEVQEVLSFQYSTAEGAENTGSGDVIVNDAADKTKMTLTATAENGEINVTGYNYAAQFIGKDHVGSKLVVTITGVEAVTGVTTNAATSTNKATSGVYEGPESDADKDGIPGEIETPFPVPNTYLTSEYYYLDENGKVTFEIKDFLMDEGINISDGHHIFTPAEPGTTLATEYGTATVNTDGTVTYQLKEGVELEKDIICLFGKTEDITVKAASANTNGNMWSEITILPPKDAVGKLHTDKSATLMGDGTYTIDLEAFATGTPALATLSTKQPLDVVLVIDQSGSLCEFYTTENAEGKKVYEWNRDALEALKGSVSSFVHELQANADANGLNHRISICGFGSDEFIGWSVGREYLHEIEANLAKEQGTELPEPGKGVENCYTYAGDLEGICFTNTGLFVNGEFKKYGTINSKRVIVNTIDDVVDDEVYIANEKGTDRYIPVTYYPGHSAWRVWASDGWWTFFNKDLTDEEKDAINAEYGKGTAAANAAIGKAEKKLNVPEFLKKYDLYTLPREITVQLTDKDYQNSWETVSVNGKLNPDIAKTIDSLAGNGATFVSYGMRMARHMLENAPDPNDEEGVVRKKVVIVFTDGRPGGTDIKNAGEAEAALAEAQQIKNGLVDKNGKAIKAEIYTVGIYKGETKGDDEFMNLLSSNCASHTFSELEPQQLDNKDYDRIVTNDYLFIPKYFYKLEKGNGDVEYCPIKVYWKSSETGYEWYYITDEGLNRIPSGTVTHRTITGAYKLESGEYNPDLGYYSNSDNFSDLPGLFREIVKEVSTYSSEVQLDAKAILKDVMADGFTLTNNTQITVSVVPGSVKEGFADVGANRLGAEHIDWGTPQKVLTFKYSEAKEGTGKVVVNGAADQTEMTLSAKVTSDGVITVTGFNYAAALDNHKENAQYICAGHPGSKLVVTITGVEAKNGVTTDSFTVTNKGASGIYEASDSDLDGDGTFGEMQAYFPIPTTYLSSKTYYVDYSGELIIDPADFLMTIKGYSLDKYGYHGFGAPGTIIEMDHGTVTVLDDGKLKFTMKPDGLDITDTFYLFGHTDNATVKAAMANTTGNMWSKVTIITPEDITGKLFLDKEATLTGDGTYTIDLNAYATGTPSITSITEGVPLDVVLVVDQSGSLHNLDEVTNLDKLKSAVSALVGELKVNGEAFGISHRVAICGFASGDKDGGTTEKLGFSYAGSNKDTAWLNTGLFVNGVFKDYGTVEYTQVTDVKNISIAKGYSVKYDPDGDGVDELILVRCDDSEGNYQWCNMSYLGGKYVVAEGQSIAEACQALLDNCEVYVAGRSTDQLTVNDYKNAWEYIADGANGQGGLNADITKAINSLAANGATRISYGLKMATQLLKNTPDDDIERKKVVIVFTDGAPGYGSYSQGDANAALSEAKRIKEEDGTEIYTVGIYDSDVASQIESFMNQLSSNYASHEFSTETSKGSFWGLQPGYDVNNDEIYMLPYFYKVENGDGTADYWPVKVTSFMDNRYNYQNSWWYITDTGDVLITTNTSWSMSGLYTISSKSNNDPDADYYLYSNSFEDLTGMFKDLIGDATTVVTQATLDANMILKDVMADGFTLTGNTTITVSVVPGSVKEKYANLTADELTSDKITWGEPQQVLSFAYPTETEKSGSVVVNGAADRTEKMTLTAKVTEDGIITVDGFNYAGPTDPFCIDAQYIRAGHPGSKLVVTITGVEAKTDVVTDSVTTTNNGTSGIYESEDSDMDGDGDKHEMQASFPIPTTYLTSEYYYLEENNSVTFNPKDFLMTIKGINADPDGYNFFDVNNPGTTVETQYGKVTVNEDGTVTYQLTNTDWENEDIFYLFGKTEDPIVTDADANKDGNMWSKITILPPKDVGGKLHVDKEATLESNGTYTIDLEAFATGTPVSTIIKDGIPLDVVLVIDQSGSMITGDAGANLADLKTATTNFVNALYENGEHFGINHRVSICGFAAEGTEGVTVSVANGHSFADDNYDMATWVNTGLFVDGEFKRYGKSEFVKLTSDDELDPLKSYLIEWPVQLSDGTTITQMPYITYQHAGKWEARCGGWQTLSEKGDTTGKAVLENYTVYEFKNTALQLTDKDYSASWENIAVGANGTGGVNPMITNYISHFAGAGPTRTQYGMKMARHMLENAPDDGVDRKQIVVVFTDGAPGHNGYIACAADPAIEEAGLIKDMGIEIYSVALSKSLTGQHRDFVNQLSSNYKAPTFEKATFDIREAKESQQAAFMINTYMPQVQYAKAPLFYYHEADKKFYQIVAYWWSKDEIREGRNLVNVKEITIKYITDTNEDFLHTGEAIDETSKGFICKGTSFNDINTKMAKQPVYKLVAPKVNDQAKTNYLLEANNSDTLNNAFGTVVEEMTTYTSEVMLDSTAILKDVMADGFTLTDNTTITVSVVPGSVEEEYANLDPDKLTEAHIDWSAPQQVLTFAYPAKTSGTGNVIVNGAADQTQMTLKAEVKDGVITVTGFNYASPADNHKENAQYICAGHPGSKLVVTITGVEAQSNVVTDSVTVTNKGTSGIYEGPNSDADGDGVPNELQASFPIPTTYMASKVYVVDYAKTMTINPSDFKMTVGAVSVDVDGYNHFDPAVTAVTGTYGKVTVEGGKITYTPTKTNWNGYDSFYVFGTTDNATIKAATANENGNMWAKVSVVPANNVYYEDTFVTNQDTGVVGIVFGGVWEEVDEAGNTNAGGNGQGENAESGESTTKDDKGNDHQGGVHGWEDNLADDTGFSDGSAHIAGKIGATATFTFTGTGVDIYSRTNDKTGMVIATLYEGAEESGKNLVAKYTLMVDNLAASGDYYQIPTLSFFQIPLKIDGKIQKDENGNTIMTDLPYGTYTVKIIVSKVVDSQTNTERTLYYLDGIRVYNPVQELEKEDSTVSGAYGEKELNANFVEIRDKLLDANSFSAEDAESAGPVFIDRITSEDGSHTDNTKTVEIGTYKVFGPKNEVYLSANQIVAFAVPYTEGAHYYIGMKSLTGKTVKVIPNSTDDYVNLIVVGHTTDQYYEIVPEWEYDEHGNPTTGIIFVHADITNGDYKKDEDGNYITDENGDYTYEGAILALTKLKVTGPKAKNFKFARVSNDKLLEMIAEDLAPSLDMDDTNSSPDVGGNTPNKPNVDINKPSSDTTVDEQTALKNLMIDLLTRIFGDLRGWFKS